MKEVKKKKQSKKSKVKNALKGLDSFEHIELSRLCIGPNDSLSMMDTLK